MESIALAYAGVHQIFQLALAAQEMGELEMLHCSLIDQPGKWGGIFPSKLGIPSARSLGHDQLLADKVIEHPSPLLAHRLSQKLLPGRPSDHRHSNAWFDLIVSHHLKQSSAEIFVGVETCALISMQTAKQKGMRCVLDCPGIPHKFLDQVAQEAATELGFKLPASSNSPAMEERKRRELELADVILCCSGFQAEKLIETGADADKLRVIPLWADAAFWGGHSATPPSFKTREKLKVIYAGAISLKKGAPYLLEAMQQLDSDVQLTLVGNPSAEMSDILEKLPPNCTHQSYVPRHVLRELYAAHDVLIMPSLGDSFGFVAMEAMAAGLPVIASSHTGVPLPSPEWRVPARSSHALAERLRHYAMDRRALAEDSITAMSFAAQWTPERYRTKVREVFAALLS